MNAFTISHPRHVKNFLTTTILFACLAAALGQNRTSKVEFEELKEGKYLKITKQNWSPHKDLELRPKETVPSAHYDATLQVTDAQIVPYDKAEGAITITNRDGEKSFIKLDAFKTAKIRWINERLLFIDLSIGHVYSVEAIFDAQKGVWIYRSGKRFYKWQ